MAFSDVKIAWTTMGICFKTIFFICHLLQWMVREQICDSIGEAGYKRSQISFRNSHTYYLQVMKIYCSICTQNVNVKKSHAENDIMTTCAGTWYMNDGACIN